MRLHIAILFGSLFLAVQSPIFAQNVKEKTSAEAPVINLLQRDTLYDILLPDVFVTHTRHRARQLSIAEKRELWRLIRDVKITLPYAKMIAGTLIETYEYMETLPNDKSRNKHLKLVERDLKKEYTPKMKKLTLRQGKLLIRLVDRQCNQSSYRIVSAFFGSWKAAWWNLFARINGANLKSRYNPKENEDDALTERIVLLVEDNRI